MATKTSIKFVQRHGTAVDELKVPSLEYLVQLRIVHMYTRNYPEDAPVTCISMCHIFYVSTFKLAFGILSTVKVCIYFLNFWIRYFIDKVFYIPPCTLFINLFILFFINSFIIFIYI